MKLPVNATVAGLFSVPAERVFDAFLDKNMIERFMFCPEISPIFWKYNLNVN